MPVIAFTLSQDTVNRPVSATSDTVKELVTSVPSIVTLTSVAAQRVRPVARVSLNWYL